MKTSAFPLFVLVAACGGQITTPAPDATRDAGPDVHGDVLADVLADVSPDTPDTQADVVEEVVCECVGADLGTYVCNGVQETDAMSCAFCGGHCNSTPDQ